MHKALTEHIMLLKESFCFNLEQGKTLYGIENIHELRVSVKKFRAIIRMTEELYPDSSQKLTSLIYLRKIFKGAAFLRDIHIVQSLSPGYNINTNQHERFIKYINKLEKRGQIRFKRGLRYELKAISSLEELELSFLEIYSKFDSDKLIQDIEILVENRINLLVLLVTESKTDVDIHKIRIKLKELNFIFDIRFGLSISNKMNQLKLIALQLGEWHDKVIFLYYINRFLKTRLFRKSQFQKLQTIFNSLSEKNNDDKEKIKVNLLENLVNFNHEN